MQIKRFSARSMSEALQMIKAELGPDAVILSARTVKKNGAFLDTFRKAEVEVTAAGDAPQTIGYRKSSKNPGRLRQPGLALDPARTGRTFLPEPSGAADGRFYPAERDRRQSVRSDKDDRLRDSWLYRRLITQGVRQEYALEIASELLSDSLAEDIRDEQVLTALGRALLKVGVDTRDLFPPAAKRVALVGASGVGKTACAAKIAAVQAMQCGRRPAMISLDNYRIGATGQLQRCADILGIPLVVTDGPEELRQAFCQLAFCDLILIDTPALRRTDERMLERLRNELKCAGTDEIHFVCSASSKEKDTLELFKALKGIPVDRLLFTKLDETASYGTLLNLCVQLQVPASGFSSGQQIPNSLEGATIGRLAELILNGRGQVTPANTFDPAPPENRVTVRRRRKSPTAAFTANKNTYLFHTADCIWTRLIKKDNRVVFNSAAEALASKFKPCNDCCEGVAEQPELRYQGGNRAKAIGSSGAGSDPEGYSDSKPPFFIPVRSA